MSENKVYVGNLSFQATEDAIKELFEEAGAVESVSIITDRNTGRSRGFGFVEMDTPEAANAAVEKFNGVTFMERDLVVNIARPRTERREFGSEQF